MDTLTRATELAQAIGGQGVRAVTEPRSAVPPCVLVTPPARIYDLACGFTARWKIYALAPAPATADTWAALDQLLAAIESVLPIERAEPTSYTIQAGTEPVPAYVCTIEEAS